MAIKLKEYLVLHPDEGVELLTEYGFYTMSPGEVKAQLRCPGSIRSVTGRPLSVRALLEQEVLDVTGGKTPLVYTARSPREQEHLTIEMGGI